MESLYSKIYRKRITKVHNISNERKCELHHVLRRHMLFFRWVGMFPVEGLGDYSVQKLRFKLKSFYGIYYFVSLLGQAIFTILSAFWCFSGNNYSSSSVTNLVFYFTAFLVMMAMFELGKKWPTFIRRLAKIETQLKGLRRDSGQVKKHCNYVLWFIGLVCFVEHFLSLLFHYKLLWNCYGSRGSSMELVKIFCTYRAPYLFTYTQFAPWKIIVFKFVNCQTVILWGLTDVIPTCASLYLISYFKDLNAAIDNKHFIRGPKFWEKHRMYYTHLVSLVSLVDERIKTIVLLSFFNYLYFISVHLFYLLNYQLVNLRTCEDNTAASTVERIFYFLFSAMFIVVRALTLSLLASEVHVEARKSMLTLYDVSKEEDSKEVQRFRLQLIYNPISLTGSFFPLTKTSILKFLSTIITYELVLLQLNQKRKSNITFMLKPFNEHVSDNTINVQT